MKQTNTILDKIIEVKAKEVLLAKKFVSLDEIKNSVSKRQTSLRNFHQALQKGKPVSLIAEIKKASPSKGVIKQEFDHVKIAEIYESSSVVDAISVLTDKEYFQGQLSFVKDVKNVTSVPILRKDFIIDEYQVYESYIAEADAILLIVAALEKEQLSNLLKIAEDLGLACLVEVHTAKELATAVDINAKIIGINARDLKTFTIDTELFASLATAIPDGILRVAESGIENFSDVDHAHAYGADAVLVGSSIMKSENIKEKLQELKGITHAD